MHGGVKFYRGAAKAARAYVERDRSRADDYFLAEGSGGAERLIATTDGVSKVGGMDGDAYEEWVAGVDTEVHELLEGEVRRGPRIEERAPLIGPTGTVGPTVPAAILGLLGKESRAQPSRATRARSSPTSAASASVRSRSTCQRIAGSPSSRYWIASSMQGVYVPAPTLRTATTRAC